MQRTGHTSSLL